MKCISFSSCLRVLTALFLAYVLLLSPLFRQTVLAQVNINNDNGCTITPSSATMNRPNKNSLLLVLLDRSGSLIDPPDPTDPYRLSTSVTRALTDLWPGKMAVITFPQVQPLARDKVQQLGPADLTDPTQLSSLKNSIPEADPNGNTPLGPAMDATLALLHKGSIPAGSRAILITDGDPNTSTDPSGTLEMHHIEQDLLPQFQQLGFPISTFGLTVKPGSAEDTFLTKVANVSGGEHTIVASAGELAQSVMQLYANWSGQQFYCASRDSNGNYEVTLNEFTKQATIIAFRSAPNYAITVHDPKGNLLVPGVGVNQSLDPHYQLDQLNVTPPVLTGSYSVSMSNDPGAQVYWFVNSRLQVGITAPTSNVAPGPVAITGVLYDDNKTFQPRPGAVLQAELSFTSGHTTILSEVNLVQQGNEDRFSGNSPSYEAGTLKIQVIATYEEIHSRSDEQTIKIQIPWWQNPAIIIPGILGLAILVALAILFLLWTGLPSPHGTLISEQNPRNTLELGSYRSVPQRISHKSMITLKELSQHPDGMRVLGPLLGEPLAFVFTKTEVFLRLTGSSERVSVISRTGEVKHFNAVQKELPLESNDQICRNDIPVIRFR